MHLGLWSNFVVNSQQNSIGNKIKIQKNQAMVVNSQQNHNSELSGFSCEFTTKSNSEVR